jgi:hypothetical protein
MCCAKSKRSLSAARRRLCYSVVMPSYLIKTRATIANPDTIEGYAQIWQIAANDWVADFALCKKTDAGHYVFIAQVTAGSAESARYMLWNMQATVNRCMPEKLKVSFFWDTVQELVDR